MNPSTRRAALGFAQRLAGTAAHRIRALATPILRNRGFPYTPPTLPATVERVEPPPRLGVHYDTDWARSSTAEHARSAFAAGPLRLGIDVLARPVIEGVDRLNALTEAEAPPAAIFTPNHHSHLDTALMIRAIPAPLRRHLVVAAAADYFFDARWKAAVSALALNAVPVERIGTNRASSDRLRDLIQQGYSLLIYPEGGRSPDGWGQTFKGGAAYLSIRTQAPVVPVYIDGTGSILGKGATWPRPGRAHVVFGRPLRPEPDESTRRFNARIERSVAQLNDEAATDYWTAARRAADGQNTDLTGPDHHGWRRQWALTEHRANSASGQRSNTGRRWPRL